MFYFKSVKRVLYCVKKVQKQFVLKVQKSYKKFLHFIQKRLFVKKGALPQNWHFLKSNRHLNAIALSSTSNMLSINQDS